eukprot:2180949-Amphidinium_carterae.2
MTMRSEPHAECNRKSALRLPALGRVGYDLHGVGCSMQNAIERHAPRAGVVSIIYLEHKAAQLGLGLTLHAAIIVGANAQRQEEVPLIGSSTSSLDSVPIPD